MASTAKKAPPPPDLGTLLVEHPLGDTAILVREFRDGTVVLELEGEARTTLTQEQFFDFVSALVTVGRDKGWVTEADGCRRGAVASL